MEDQQTNFVAFLLTITTSWISVCRHLRKLTGIIATKTSSMVNHGDTGILGGTPQRGPHHDTNSLAIQETPTFSPPVSGKVTL